MSDLDHVLSNRAPADLDKLYSVMVFNLSYRTSKEDLYDVFAKFGRVVDVHIPRSRNSDAKGFAFVRYLDRAHASHATQLDGTRLLGRQIGVQLAKYGRRDAARQRRARERTDHYDSNDRYHRRSRSRSADRYHSGRYGGGGGGGYGSSRYDSRYDNNRYDNRNDYYSRRRDSYSSRRRSYSRSRSPHYRYRRRSPPRRSPEYSRRNDRADRRDVYDSRESDRPGYDDLIQRADESPTQATDSTHRLPVEDKPPVPLYSTNQGSLDEPSDEIVNSNEPVQQQQPAEEKTEDEVTSAAPVENSEVQSDFPTTDDAAAVDASAPEAEVSAETEEQTSNAGDKANQD